MADINYMDYGEDDNGINSDYYNSGDDEYGFDDVDSQENHLPVDKLETYIVSDNTYTRQLVATGLPEVLKNAKDARERQIVLDAVSRLAQDDEASVKTEILERIPQLADYCIINSPVLEGLSDGIHATILPSVVQCLHDGDNQVRKMSQMALLFLLENRMVDQVDIEEIVCPVLLELFTPDRMPEEFRTEAVTLMVRISPLVSTHVVETQFLPRFCELCSEAMFHIRKVCATSIGEMCRVVGPNLAETYLLPKFFNLCEDSIWGVRKACTECFMEVSNALSPKARRNELAQLYVGLLCDQSRWVRMSAFQALGPFISTFADPTATGLYFDHDGILRVRPPVDSVQDTHKEEAEHKVSASSSDKQEESTEAAQSAAQSSKPDNSTDSSNETTESMKDNKKSEANNASTDDNSNEETGADAASADTVSVSQDDTAPPSGISENDMDLSADKQEGDVSDNLVFNPSISPEEVRWRQYTKDTEMVYVEGEAEASKVDDFGSFKYWREPVPTLDIAAILQEVSQTSNTEVANKQNQQEPTDYNQCKDDNNEFDTKMENLSSSLESELEVHSDDDTTPTQENRGGFVFGPDSAISNPALTYASVLASSTNSGERRLRNMSTGSSESAVYDTDDLALQQDIIPHLLLENYLSMTDPSRAQTVDMDIAQHCAYSLPAVAFTLGKENWKCLKPLYDSLVIDMQWKVRRTLAYSIHELAVILGSELTHSDLIPIFNGFIKDLDEVRIGILTHLYDFVKLLDGPARKSYLPRLKDFMETDNVRVWRTRQDLAHQLEKLCELFSPDDVAVHIVPLTLSLLTDKVAAVRTASLPLISRVLRLLKHPEQNQLRVTLINDLIEKLALSNRWNARQTYVQACYRTLLDDSLELDQFAKELLPSIINLSEDKTPNVRVAVALLFSQCLLPLEYFTSGKNPHHDRLIEVEAKLKSDSDRDVKYFLSLAPQNSIRHQETVEV